jgi:hypothetical protein
LFVLLASKQARHVQDGLSMPCIPSTGGVVIKKTQTAMVLGFYDEAMQPGEESGTLQGSNLASVLHITKVLHLQIGVIACLHTQV